MSRRTVSSLMPTTSPMEEGNQLARNAKKPRQEASSHGRRNTLNFERLRRPCRFRRIVFGSGIG
jgi:hypothetical protein